jgi:serine/threonine protein kinase
LSSRGTSGYRAPEVLREEAIYTNKVDIWAIGCILYELATGNKTFHDDWAAREYAFGSDEISLPEVSSWPSFANSQLFDLLKQLLQKEWNKRPDAKSLCSSLLTSLESLPQHFSKDALRWVELIHGHPEARYLHSLYTAHWESITDYDDAIDGWKRLVGDHPAEEAMHEELIGAIGRKGPPDYLLAASVWQELVERHPDIGTFESRLQHACLNISDEDLTVGMTRLRMVADKYPSNLGLQRSLAVWYSTRGDMGQELIELCKRNLGELSSRCSERYWWAVNLATAYESIEDHSSALGVWKAAAILHQEAMMQGNGPLLPWGLPKVLHKLSDAFERLHSSSHVGRKAAWSELISSFPCLLTPEEERASGINWQLIVAGESGPRSLAIDPHNPKDFENVSRGLETADIATDSLPSLSSIREQQLAQELSAKTNELADVRKALTEAKQIIKKLKEPPNRPPNALSQKITSKPADKKVQKVDPYQSSLRQPGTSSREITPVSFAV